MSTNPDDLPDDDENEPAADHLRALRAKAKRADALEAELETLRRDSAFTKALGPALESDPRLGYFQRGYQGETTPEAIRQAATEAGFLTAPTAQVSQTMDLSAHQRLAQASQGASEPKGPLLEDAIAAAKTPEEVMDLMEAAGFPTVRTRQ